MAKVKVTCVGPGAHLEVIEQPEVQTGCSVCGFPTRMLRVSDADAAAAAPALVKQPVTNSPVVGEALKFLAGLSHLEVRAVFTNADVLHVLNAAFHPGGGGIEGVDPNKVPEVELPVGSA